MVSFGLKSLTLANLLNLYDKATVSVASALWSRTTIVPPTLKCFSPMASCVTASLLASRFSRYAAQI
jgi:hypothetical protein